MNSPHHAEHNSEPLSPEQKTGTVLHAWHQEHAKTMADFGGFDMPIEYKSDVSGGTVQEHLTTRRASGLFDVSHMGRFEITGRDAFAFLQYALSNNVAALDRPGIAQYTMIPNLQGGVVDDAYVYFLNKDHYLLVVNAGNRTKDWNWLQQISLGYQAKMVDLSDETSMLSLQGPASERILETILRERGNLYHLPEPQRNCFSDVRIDGIPMRIARTGYTGEPVGFELFVPAESTLQTWEMLLEYGAGASTHGNGKGIVPVGLGARDTLRLEAGLPLYGHELSDDMPLFSVPIAPLAYKQVAGKNGIAHGILAAMANERTQRERLRERFQRPLEERLIKRVVYPLAVMNDDLTGPGKKPARQGYTLFLGDREVGVITSGTAVPLWKFDGNTILSSLTEEQQRRPIALAYVDADLFPYDPGLPSSHWQVLTIKDPKGSEAKGILVSTHARATAPYIHPVIHPEHPRITGSSSPEQTNGDGPKHYASVQILVGKTSNQNILRQRESLNFIPSENTPSRLVRALQDSDAAGRYGEHKHVEAFGHDAPDVFYYQGTGFIGWVEQEVVSAFQRLLKYREIEPRSISGQQANETVFSGMARHKNRAKVPGTENQRLASVMTHRLGYGYAHPCKAQRHVCCSSK
ncbi:hypothetical protein HZB02_05815 [Candidatus Woesearchaeota archaeon]|nr:hypothetical protein [Candidatus Woesearchaeota archaeon]